MKQMTYFFEHTKKIFVCPLCRKDEDMDDKCFIRIRQRNIKSPDGRKNMVCKSTSICMDCYKKIEAFVISLGPKT